MIVSLAAEALGVSFVELEFHPYREGLIRQGMQIRSWRQEAAEDERKAQERAAKRKR